VHKTVQILPTLAACGLIGRRLGYMVILGAKAERAATVSRRIAGGEVALDVLQAALVLGPARVHRTIRGCFATR